MIKKALAAVGVVAAGLAMSAAPAMAIGDADGSATSLQGNGGTNHTGTEGNHSPNNHVLDNPNICLPEIDNVAVAALIGIAVPIKADVLDNHPTQTCVVGQNTVGSGDGGVSHLIG
ncbi:rodlet layer protein [Kitasatospora sp. NPDC059673]|uniref:rodlet layer protein n=1 Tax=Kitasatospora sp. NPDC059673 TaxID=3346901 RepID=UPI0036C79E51